jgi:hypothetical protein
MNRTSNAFSTLGRDLVACTLLASVTLSLLFMLKNWYWIVNLLGNDTISYTSEYIESLEGFRGNMTAANITQLIFWLIIASVLYALTLIVLRSLSNIREFYVIERFYVNKRPLRADIYQILLELVLISALLSIISLTVLNIIPWFVNVFILSLTPGAILVPSSIWGLSSALLGSIYCVLLYLHRWYLQVRKTGELSW